MFQSIINDFTVDSLLSKGSIFNCAYLALAIVSSIYISKKLKSLSAIQNNAFILAIGILPLVLDIATQTYSLIGVCGVLCALSYFIKPQFIKNIIYFFICTFCLSYSITSYILMIFSGLDYIQVISRFIVIFIGLYLIITRRIEYKGYGVILSGGLYVMFCLIEMLCRNSFAYLNIIFNLLILLFAIVINKIIQDYTCRSERESC